MNSIYQSAILAEKKEDFLIFLQHIGVSDEEIQFDEEDRGSIILYAIDLSAREFFEIHSIKAELSRTGTDFL